MVAVRSERVKGQQNEIAYLERTSSSVGNGDKQRKEDFGRLGGSLSEEDLGDGWMVDINRQKISLTV